MNRNVRSAGQADTALVKILTLTTFFAISASRNAHAGLRLRGQYVNLFTPDALMLRTGAAAQPADHEGGLLCPHERPGHGP